MAIKITDKILSIPPYISTSWSSIATLHMKEGVLIIKLLEGDTIHIPDLNSETIHLIFEYHVTYLEKERLVPADDSDLTKLKEMMEKDEHSIHLAFGTSMDGLGNLMQHNPNQADAPNLPPEILQKISAINKIISPTEELVLPNSEPGCNCFFCQIARTLNPETTLLHKVEEPVISDAELQFQQWDIEQTGEKLYCLINRLDEHEKYNVYLGQPVGCTCGKQGCEHILAVLKS